MSDVSEQDASAAYTKAHELFAESGWTFDPDTKSFLSPNNLCSLDLQTAIGCLLEGGEDTLIPFIRGGEK